MQPVNVLRPIDTMLFGPGTSRRLVVAHVGLASVIGLRIALGPYPRLAGQPDALFRPLSFVRVLDAMPPLAVIVGIQVVGVIAAALAVAGWRRRATFATAWVSLLVLAGLRTSVGKILHNDVVLLLAAVPFLLAPAVRWPGRDEPSARCGWPVHTAMVIVAGAYFFSGLAKFTTSGIEWVTGDNLRYVMYDASLSGRMIIPELPRFVADHAWLAHVVAAGTLVFELTFPIVLVVRRVRPLYAAWAVTLHAGTWLLLGLDYWLWIAVVLLIVVDPSYAMYSTKRSSWRRLRHSKTPSQWVPYSDTIESPVSQ
jgi:hypothetical protein